MLDYSDIAKMFEDMELRIVANLKEQLNNGYDLNPNDWQVKKLRNLNAFRQNNIKIMNDYKPLTETKKLIEDNFRNGVIEAEKFVGQPHFLGINEERMNKLIDDMTALEKHVETAALRMTDDVYRRTLHMATLEMSAGTSLEKAIDMATKSFLDQGINCIIYADGRHVNIADYVRMALRTASMKATLQGKSGRFSQLGYDTVLISQYDKCSDTCLPYQGRVYIDDTFTLWDGEVEEIGGELWGKSNYCGKWFPLLSTAIYGGLFHPNCRHDMDLYIDGKTTMPEPIDSEKDLENYRLQQQQRAMERNIRKLRRLAAGSCDKQTAKAYGAKVKQAQAELKQFISDNSTVLHREFDREKIYENNNIVNEQGISGKKANRTSENTVDLEYIQSKEYKNKFKSITNNSKVNEQIYKQAKAILTHRNGTQFEDMVLIDGNTGKIAGSQSSSKSDYGVDYNDSLKNAIKTHTPYTLISIHNHPTNNPPTGSDIVSNGSKKYKLGVVVTHDGKVFTYKAGTRAFLSDGFGLRVDKFRKMGYNEYEAIVKTLEIYKRDYGIEWGEIS